MGCGDSRHNVDPLPIKANLMHLVQSGKNQQIIAKLQQLGPQVLMTKLNFRGDTIAHYACAKNNVQLIKYLISVGADFNCRNQVNKLPAELTRNRQILKLLGKDISQDNKLSLTVTEINTNSQQEIIKVVKTTETELKAPKIIQQTKIYLNPQAYQINKDQYHQRPSTNLTKLIKTSIQKIN